MKYQYTYTGENPCDFPTIGLRAVEKGETVESDEPLFSPFLVEISTAKPSEKEEKGA